MSDFEFPTEKRFSRLTSARAELINARFSEVATASATKLDKTGGSVTGALSVSGNFSVGGTFAVTGNATFGGTLAVTGAVTLSAALTLPGNPASNLHAAPKQYVDAGDAALAAAFASADSGLASAITAGDATRLPLAGGTMSGAIAMGGNKITGAGAPTDAGDYATKAYADALAFSATLPGITGIATEAEARAGLALDKVMPPLRVNQAIQSLVPPAGQRTFTATGTLPNGATVVLNSDGTVSTVTSNNDTTGTATVFRSATTTYIASAALSATQVVVCYYDGGGGYAVIGTVSGTGVIFGTAVTFTTSAATYTSVCALSPTSFAVVWREGNDTYGKARVGSVSGTTISFPTAAVNFNTASTSFISIAALSSTAVVIAYQDTGNSSYGTAIIGTISGTTITFGSEYVFRSATTDAVSVTALSSSSFVVSLNASGEPAGRVYAATVSGTAITYGGSVQFDTAATPYTSIVALTSTTFMVAWARSTTDGRAKIGTVSGTTVSFTGASDVVFNAGSTSYVNVVKLSATQVIVAYSNSAEALQVSVNVGDFSGLNVVFQARISVNSSNSLYISASPVGSNLFLGYRNNGNSNYGTGVVFQPAATNIASVIGITSEAIANGASGLVTILGGVNTSQSGLTTSATYYYANNGTLTTTATSYKAGRAFNATSLLLTGNA